MNIFLLSLDAQECAELACNKHIIKQILESAQLLCSQFQPGAAPYKRTHYNHPCSIWTRQSKQNFEWLLDYSYCLLNEYTFRYEKIHKSKTVIDWCKNNYKKLKLPNIGLTEHPQCFGDYKHLICPGDPVKGYRNYYIQAKSHLKSYKNREVPKWFK
jgi:hypothetical protein